MIFVESIGINLLCTILGITFTALAFNRSRDKDLKKDARENAELKAKLDYISKGVDDIRIDMKTQQRDIQELKERVSIAEQSLRSVHKRIDILEGEKR